MVGVLEGLNLGSIPNFFLCFGMHPKIIDVHPKLIPKGGVVQFCHHFTHWTHPDTSLSFRAGGRRLKNFRFSGICIATCKKIRRPAADSILMPLTFPIARLNRYTPNFSGVTQKLTWCQQFGLQIFPK